MVALNLQPKRHMQTLTGIMVANHKMTEPFLKSKRWLVVLCFSALALIWEGCRGPKADSTADANTFRVGELVRIDFRGISNGFHKIHSGIIKEDGSITLPDVGAITFTNKTVVEIHEELTDRYSSYYKNMRLWINSYPEGIYYVGGEVNQPGPRAYLGKTTVTTAIQAAGDFTEFANKKRAVLIRGERRKTVSLAKTSAGQSRDPPVHPGDRIEVPHKRRP